MHRKKFLLFPAIVSHFLLNDTGRERLGKNGSVTWEGVGQKKYIFASDELFE